MKPMILIATVGLGALAACASLDTYYKPGTSVATLNRETTACQVKALRDVPVTQQIRRNPPIFVPGERVCNAEGKCKTRPDRYIDGGIETYDPNEGLRLRVERQCMADKGFAPVSIPACPDAVARSAPSRATTRLPALTEGSCVIRNPDGSFQIVTRG
ncbi:hypothetical protein [Sulfitobacter noctilucicola]|nr:hypothetical protein [Sulfitobacter noctilucicola]